MEIIIVGAVIIAVVSLAIINSNRRQRSQFSEYDDRRGMYSDWTEEELAKERNSLEEEVEEFCAQTKGKLYSHLSFGEKCWYESIRMREDQLH